MKAMIFKKTKKNIGYKEFISGKSSSKLHHDLLAAP
jgi:hypothetical protein